MASSFDLTPEADRLLFGLGIRGIGQRAATLLCEKFGSIDNIIKADFDEMAEAKMYFEKPEDAAEHVNRIYNDVGAWWNSEKVQKARKRFTEKYALNSKTYIKDWAVFAKSLPA